MPKPCPRCGLENTDEATRCSRCDAPLRDAMSISPEFRRFLLWLLGFAVITAIGVTALVYVHETAIPLGDPVVPPIDTAAQEQAFAQEQAREAPPPAAGATGTFPASPPVTSAPPAPSGPVAGIPAAGTAPAPAPGTSTSPGGTPLPDSLDPLLGEEDITGQMPEIPSTLEWNREILPPTGHSLPQPGATPLPPTPDSDAAPTFPETNPLSTFPPLAPPEGMPAPAEQAPDTARQDAIPGGAPGTPEVAPDAFPGAGTDATPGTTEPQAPGSAPTPSTDPARSLAATQQAQCAGEGFLTRFVCHERVRLAYCENRWNQHPDCMLEGNATNY